MSSQQVTRWALGFGSVVLAVLPGCQEAGPPRIFVTNTAAEVAADDDSALHLVALERAVVPLEHVIGRGETLDRMLRRVGVPEAEARKTAASLATVMDARKLRAHDTFYSSVRLDRGVVGITIPLRGQGVALAERRGGVWTSRYRPYQRTEVRRTVHGEVRGGLESSLRVAGGPTSLAVSMAGVLQWDLDFNRDLRLGDEFEVLFDELLLDGEHERVLVVHALRYRNRDRWHEAFRYTGAEDDRSNYYYNADGQPLRRQFLSSPLPYSRVTSRFSMSRFHPILKRRMPHYGVDYGAPVGTPVRATASGTVLSAGVRGGGGRTVRLKHPHDYLTAYLHLSRYGEGIRAGARVEQGQVIGYVGSSGLSTGPHLDYRVQHRGRWINPARLTNDRIPPLAGDQLGPFLERRDALRRELRGGPGSAIRAGL